MAVVGPGGIVSTGGAVVTSPVSPSAAGGEEPPIIPGGTPLGKDKLLLLFGTMVGAKGVHG